MIIVNVLKYYGAPLGICSILIPLTISNTFKNLRKIMYPTLHFLTLSTLSTLSHSPYLSIYLSIYLSVCMSGGWVGGVGLVLCHRPHALHPNYGHSRPPIAPASGDDGIVGHVALLGRSDS